MTQLFLDIGNSRVKYLKQSSTGQTGGHCPLSELSRQEALFSGVTGIWCSCVGGDTRRVLVYDMIKTRAADVTMVESQQLVRFFRPAYDRPDTMGVDRWLALLAVMDRHEMAPIVVADAGTALTIDVLVGDQHLGGYILPGFRTQLDAMVGKAALPGVKNGRIPSMDLGTSTEQAMTHGVWLGLASAVRTVCQNHEGAKLYLTGGDGASLMAIIDYQAQLRDNLVLEGLMKLCTESVN